MENIILNTKKHLGRKQVILDCKFGIDNGKEVDKILSVQSKPIITETNCVKGKINYGGKLDTSLLYSTTNGEKISLIAVSDFSETFESNEIDEDSLAIIDCKLVDITTPSIKTNEVKVACIVDVNVCTISKSEIDTNYEKENIIIKQSQNSITRHLCDVADNFDICEEIKLEDTLNQILKIDYNLSLKDCFCGNGFLVVDAECFVCITYEDENADTKFFKTHFPIKQEIECPSSTSECCANINVCALSYIAKTVVTQANNYNLIKCDIPIQIRGNVYEIADISCVEDAYSTSEIISCSFDSVKALKSSCSHFYEDTCKGNIPIKDNLEDVKVLALLSSNCEVANYTIDEDKLTIEGVLSTTILYSTGAENEEEKPIITPAIAEFGFVTTTNTTKLKNCTDLNVHCGINDLDINVKNGEFEILSKLDFWIFGTCEDDIKILKKVETVSKRPNPDCAIQIFFAEKNQNIWELAKEIGLSQEEILRQNPTLQENVEQGTKIVIYHKVQ